MGYLHMTGVQYQMCSRKRGAIVADEAGYCHQRACSKYERFSFHRCRVKPSLTPLEFKNGGHSWKFPSS